MSKFEWQSFRGGYDEFAVSKAKFTKEEAVKIAKRELGLDRKGEKGYLAIGEGYVRYRYGRCEDGEPASGWWLEYSYHPRSQICFIFHRAITKDENFARSYEYVKLGEIKNV